jgi:hypothetical protein
MQQIDCGIGGGFYRMHTHYRNSAAAYMAHALQIHDGVYIRVVNPALEWAITFHSRAGLGCFLVTAGRRASRDKCYITHSTYFEDMSKGITFLLLIELILKYPKL